MFIKFNNILEQNYWLRITFKALFALVQFLLEFFVIGILVMTITFFLIDSIPGEHSLLKGLTEAQKRVTIDRFNLDAPAIVRYKDYLLNLFQGDFGISYSLRPYSKISFFIWDRFYVSFVLGMISLIFTLIIGVPLGIMVGRNPGKWFDAIVTTILAIFISTPTIIFGLMLVIMGKNLNIPYIYDANNIASWALPILALSISGIVYYVRYIRTELNSQLNSTHAKFAYLKGVSKTRFVWKHALRPALFPIATFFPTAILFSFIGSLFVEKIFNIPGSGSLFIESIQAKDQNIMLFLVLLFSFLVILSYLLRDFLYKLLDPRIRRR